MNKSASGGGEVMGESQNMVEYIWWRLKMSFGNFLKSFKYGRGRPTLLLTTKGYLSYILIPEFQVDREGEHQRDGLDQAFPITLWVHFFLIPTLFPTAATGLYILKSCGSAHSHSPHSRASLLLT